MPFGSFIAWFSQEKEQMQFKFLLHTGATLIILLIAYKRRGDRRFVFTESESEVCCGALPGPSWTCARAHRHHAAFHGARRIGGGLCLQGNWACAFPWWKSQEIVLTPRGMLTTLLAPDPYQCENGELSVHLSPSPHQLGFG